jgi:hypothetical protein
MAQAFSRTVWVMGLIETETLLDRVAGRRYIQLDES